MKDMNTMKHLAKRIANLYMHKALMDEHAALQHFVQVCSQSEDVKSYKKLDEHGKFIARFNNWWENVADCPVSDMMQLMDNFFETENYAWEDLVEYV